MNKKYTYISIIINSNTEQTKFIYRCYNYVCFDLIVKRRANEHWTRDARCVYSNTTRTLRRYYLPRSKWIKIFILRDQQHNYLIIYLLVTK